MQITRPRFLVPSLRTLAAGALLLSACVAGVGDSGENEPELSGESQALCAPTDVQCQLTEASGGSLDLVHINLEDNGQTCERAPAASWAQGQPAYPQTYGQYVYAQAPSVFPGAMYPGLTMLTGRLDGPIFDQKNTGGVLTLTGIKVGNSVPPSLALTKFDQSSTLAGIQTILSNTKAKYLPSTFQDFVDIEQLKQKSKEWNVSLDFLVGALNVGFTGSHQNVTRSHTHDRMLRLTQVFYTATVSDPDIATFLTINSKDLTDKRIRQGNPLTEVRRLDYGRELYAHVYSDSSSTSVINTFNLAMSLAGQVKNTPVSVNLGLGLTQSQLSELQNTRVQAWEVGGAAAALPLTADKFIEAIVNNSVFGGNANFNPVPLSYSLHDIVTQQPVRMSRTTDFLLEKCDLYGRTNVRFLIDRLTFVQNGDSNKSKIRGNGYLRAQSGDNVSLDIPSQRRDDNEYVDYHDKVLALTDVALNSSFNVDLHLWAEELDGLKWKGGTSVDTTFKWVPPADPINAPHAGLWSSTTNAANSAAPGQLLSVYGGTNATKSLYLRMDFKAEEFNEGKCAAGTFWTGRGCVARRFTLDGNDWWMTDQVSGVDLGSLEYPMCIADEVKVVAETFYATRNRIEPYKNQYSVELYEVDATHKDVASVASETVLMTRDNLDTGGQLALKDWATQHGAGLAANKIYRLTSSWTPGKNWYVRTLPQGIDFSIDQKSGQDLDLTTWGPKYLTVTASSDDQLLLKPSICSGANAYNLRVLKLAPGGAWKEVFTIPGLLKGGAANFKLRDALVQYGAFEPGARYQVQVTSGSVGLTKNVYIAPCASGSSWTGMRCAPSSVQELQNTTSGECIAAISSNIAGDPAYAGPGSCTGDAVGFALVNLPGGFVQLRSLRQNACLQRGNWNDLLFAPCSESVAQTFRMNDLGTSMQMIHQDSGLCVTTNGPFTNEVGLGNCALSDTGNQFVKQPHTLTAADYLIARYRGEDTHDDVSGASGQLVGDAHIDPNGQCGGAFSFDGNGDRLQLSYSQVAPAYDDYTVAFWFNTQTGGMLLATPGTSGVSSHISIDATGLSYYLFAGHWPGLSVSVPGNYLDSAWHQLVLSVDRDSPTGGRIYVDGTLGATFDATQQPGDIQNSILYIGGNQEMQYVSSGQGMVDDLRLYRAALPIQLLPTSCMP